jgi:hypothetical protein
LYFWVRDSRSGPLVYRMPVLEHSPQLTALAEEKMCRRSVPSD